MLEPNRSDTPETKEELIHVTFKVRLEDLTTVYSKYSQNNQKLRNDIDRLVRELKAAKWDLKQTTTKLEKSEQLARAVTGRVVYQSPPEKVREYHLKDATITRLQAEIVDYQRLIDTNQQVNDLQRLLADAEKNYQEVKQDFRDSNSLRLQIERQVSELQTEVSQLQTKVKQLHAQRPSFTDTLAELVDIWENYSV